MLGAFAPPAIGAWPWGAAGNEAADVSRDPVPAAAFGLDPYQAAQVAPPAGRGDMGEVARCPTAADSDPAVVLPDRVCVVVGASGEVSGLFQRNGILHPVLKALLEPGCVPPRTDPAQCVVRGSPVQQCQEGAQSGLVELAKEGDGHQTVGTTDDRQHRQHQDVRQGVQLGPVAPRPADRGFRLWGFRYRVPPCSR